MTLPKLVTKIVTAPYHRNYQSNSFGPIYDLLAFDVSTILGNFLDTIIPLL